VITIRYSSADAVRLKGEALKLGRALEILDASSGTKSALRDGYILKASKIDDLVMVKVVEAPGRFEGSNQYRASLDPIVGESTIDGIVTSTAPLRPGMSPVSAPVTAVPLTEAQAAIGNTQAFGAPLPDNPFLLYNSFATEFDGGVIFTNFYTDVAPPGDASSGYVVTDQPVWMAVLVRWAGIGPTRSVTFSEDYIRGLTGYGFYPRHVVYEGVPLVPIRYGARLPAAHYHEGRLSLAVELEQASGVTSTVGGALVMGVHYPGGVAALEWHEVLHPSSVGADLTPDTFDSEDGPYQASGYDLPAVFSWVDSDAQPRVVASFRARVRKEVGSSYRLTTGQILVARGADVSVDVSFVDSVAGLDAGLPQVEAGRIRIQKYRDIFFLGTDSVLVRHRSMRLLERPASDGDISPAAPTSLPIHGDIALLVTTSTGTVTQTQAALGYGPEESPSGAVVSSGTNGIENIGFCTPVAAGEVWSWGFINGTSATQIGIARITAAGVAAPLAAGIPRALRLSTYQREIRNESNEVVVPMGQVATIVDGGEPKIAIKKGRFGAIDFVPAASYSRFGTYYLASAISDPRYGRMFG